eukprot:1953481-Rhodomonas_salina.1
MYNSAGQRVGAYKSQYRTAHSTYATSTAGRSTPRASTSHTLRQYRTAPSEDRSLYLILLPLLVLFAQ